MGKLQVVPFANAVAVVAAAAFTFCALVAVIAPEVFFAIAQSIFHGLSLASLRVTGAWFQLGNFVLGLVTITLYAWCLSAAGALLYNRQTTH